MNVQEIKKAPRPRYSGILAIRLLSRALTASVISVIVPMPLSTFMAQDRLCGSVCRSDRQVSATRPIRLFRRLPANRCSSARICC